MKWPFGPVKESRSNYPYKKQRHSQVGEKKSQQRYRQQPNASGGCETERENSCHHKGDSEGKHWQHS
jgi:hypothetical protein